MRRLILTAVVSAVVIVALAYLGTAQSLGAHPRWAVAVALYGAPIGIGLTLFLGWITRFALWFACMDLAISAAIVWFGKRAFVASSGDNVLGGQMWFFGWIAVCACAVAVLALAVWRTTQTRAD